MLYRPKFCANCGETIDRSEWHLWTSRRFCQVCESEYKGQDLIPRVVVIVGIVIGFLGLGGYVNSSRPVNGQLSTRRPLRSETASPPASPVMEVTPQVPRALAAVTNINSAVAEPPAAAMRRPVGSTPPAAQAEPAYYCGAETKKGTPCMRHVKGNVRCYQHQGMPAMLPADKLRIQ